jgi:hypothetical protein
MTHKYLSLMCPRIAISDTYLLANDECKSLALKNVFAMAVYTAHSQYWR